MRHDDDKELHTSSSNPNLTSGLLALNTLLEGSERLLSLRLLEVANLHRVANLQLLSWHSDLLAQ